MTGTIAQAPQNGNDRVNLPPACLQSGISGRKLLERRQDVSLARRKLLIPFTLVIPFALAGAFAGYQKIRPRR